MKISAKGRYALAAIIQMAADASSDRYTTLASVSEKLGISKIFLEQAFSLLKKANLVQSVKGAQGGYRLAGSPDQLTVFDILSAVETSLFEKKAETVKEKAPDIDDTMRLCVFDVLDESLRTAMASITIRTLVDEAKRRGGEQGSMYYI